jgi:putative ABC transport system permease protein
LNFWHVLFGFVVVMLTYQASNLLSKKKIDKIPMSEALKAGSE